MTQHNHPSDPGAVRDHAPGDADIRIETSPAKPGPANTVHPDGDKPDE